MAISSLANQIVLLRPIPPVFLRKNHLPLHVMPYGYKGGEIAGFWGRYLYPKFDINRLQNNPSDGYRRQLPLHVMPYGYSGAKVLLILYECYFIAHRNKLQIV